MIKFLRKYNRRILAVVTVLLMIVFIGGTALDALLQPKPASQVVAQAFGKTVTQLDQNDFDRQVRILTRLGFPWSTPWGFDFRLQPLNTMDYMLLALEARENGLRPDLFRAREFLRRRAPSNLTEFRLQLRVSTEDVERSVANMLMVQDAWYVTQSSVCISDLDLNRAVKRMHEKLAASVVAIDAEPFVDEGQSFDEATQQAQFDKYKEHLRGAAPMDFGYLIPNQVKVEYIKLASFRIEPRRKVTRKMAEKYWQENQEEFPPPPPEDEDPLAEEEEFEEEDSAVSGFEAVEDDVFVELERRQRLEVARQMAEILRQRLTEAWFARDIAEDGYPERPAGVDAANYYRGIVDGMAAGLESPQCISVETTGLFSADTAADVPGIGGSRQDVVGRGIGLPFGLDLERVQGLEERSPEAPADARGPLALYQTASRLMADQNDNLYIYRIVEVAPAHPPAALADAREQVIADLRTAQAFQRAAGQARTLNQTVEPGALLAAWAAFDGIPQAQKDQFGRAFVAAPFARTTGSAAPVLVEDAAGNAENTIFSEDFVSQAYALLDAGGPEASGVIEVPEMQKCFVVQLGGVKHLTPDDFQLKKEEVRFRLVQDRLERLRREWFADDKIRTRCRFEFST